MATRMDEFRDFVGRYPRLRDDVRSGKRTWQNIYEEWALYGENDPQWLAYLDGEQKDSSNYNQYNRNNQQATQPQNVTDSIKNIIHQIQKINPDSLNRTLNTVQKVIQIVQSFGPKSAMPTNYMNNPYNDWWD